METINIYRAYVLGHSIGEIRFKPPKNATADWGPDHTIQITRPLPHQNGLKLSLVMVGYPHLSVVFPFQIWFRPQFLSSPSTNGENLQSYLDNALVTTIFGSIHTCIGLNSSS